MAISIAVTDTSPTITIAETYTSASGTTDYNDATISYSQANIRYDGITATLTEGATSIAITDTSPTIELSET